MTLTLDRATWHTIMHASSTAPYTLNFTQIRRNFLVDGWTDIEAGFIRLTRRNRPKKTTAEIPKSFSLETSRLTWNQPVLE